MTSSPSLGLGSCSDRAADLGGTPAPVRIGSTEPQGPAYAGERELRYQVLRRLLGLPRGSERFAFEEDCLHVVACAEGRTVGCVLFHPETPTGGRLLQMAVAGPWRRRGLGRALVQHLEGLLSQRGVATLHLHARLEAVRFYQRLGYGVVGRPFWEVGIGHRHMQRTLASLSSLDASCYGSG